MSDPGDDLFDEEDYPAELDDPCEHLDYEVDVLTGRALCPYCGEVWWLTGDELKRELTSQAQAYEAYAEQFHNSGLDVDSTKEK